jgi:hypothetical protein
MAQIGSYMKLIWKICYRVEETSGHDIPLLLYIYICKTDEVGVINQNIRNLKLSSSIV